MKTGLPIVGWGVRLISAVIAFVATIVAAVGAVYVFAPAFLGESDAVKLFFIALAFAATLAGIPVASMWVNGRVLWAFERLLRCKA